jgi:hypothetical protein
MRGKCVENSRITNLKLKNSSCDSKSEGNIAMWDIRSFLSAGHAQWSHQIAKMSHRVCEFGSGVSRAFPSPGAHQSIPENYRKFPEALPGR